MAGLPVPVVTDLPALLSHVARDDADDGRPIVGIGAVPFAPIGASAWRIGGVAMWCAFFPPRSGRAHQPQRRCRALPRSARSHSNWPGGAAVRYRAVCVTTPAHARGAPSARLWPHHAAAVPGWPVVAVSLRRLSPSAVHSSRRSPDNGRLESGPAHGTSVAPRFGSGGSAGRLGEGAAPAIACTVAPHEPIVFIIKHRKIQLSVVS
jgi:hypothetical protein